MELVIFFLNEMKREGKSQDKKVCSCTVEMNTPSLQWICRHFIVQIKEIFLGINSVADLQLGVTDLTY